MEKKQQKDKKITKVKIFLHKQFCLTHYEQMHKFFCFSLFIDLGWAAWEASGWVTQESDFVITAERTPTPF